MDEDGFMTTKKEWESCSEEEDEKKPEQIASKLKESCSVSNKSQTSKPPAPKSGGSQQPANKKQASIMNFFAKKP